MVLVCGKQDEAWCTELMISLAICVRTGQQISLNVNCILTDDPNHKLYLLTFLLCNWLNCKVLHKFIYRERFNSCESEILKWTDQLSWRKTALSFRLSKIQITLMMWLISLTTVKRRRWEKSITFNVSLWYLSMPTTVLMFETNYSTDLPSYL